MNKNNLFLFLLIFFICINFNRVLSQNQFNSPKLLNGSFESINLVYTPETTCYFVFNIGVNSSTSYLIAPSPNSIVNLDEKQLYKKIIYYNLPIGNNSIIISTTYNSITTNSSIKYSCIEINYRLFIYKIINKLYNHFMSYKSTFQIIDSIGGDIPIDIIKYSCNNGEVKCQLNKINDNTFDIVFYEIPDNYLSNWVLKLGTNEVKSFSINFESPFKNTPLLYNTFISNSQPFISTGQHQVKNFYTTFVDNANNSYSQFFIPPPIKFKSISPLNNDDIMRKMKLVEVTNGLIKFEGKSIDRQNTINNITPFEINYNLTLNSNSIQFKIQQINNIIQPNITSNSINSNSYCFEVAISTPTRSNFIHSFSYVLLNDPQNIEINYNLDLPYGIVSFSMDSEKATSKIPTPYNSKTNLRSQFQSLNNSFLMFNVGPPNTQLGSLVINKVEFITLDQGYYILKINVTDTLNGLRYIKLSDYTFGNSILTQGTIKNGIFEFQFSYLDSLVDFKTFNLYISNGLDGNGIQLAYGDYIYNSDQLSILSGDPLLESLKNSDIKIKNISFLNSKINSTDQDNWNIMYLELNDQIQNYEPMLTIIKDVTEESYLKNGQFDSTETSSKYYFGKWSKDYNLYIIEFFIPKNIKSGYLAYSLSLTYNKYRIVYNQDLSIDYQVTIESKYTDYKGPIVSDIYPMDPVQDITYTAIGWKLRVVDEINGLKEGYVVVRGVDDYSYYNFTLSSNSIKSGTLYNGTHDIIIQVANVLCGKGNSMSFQSKFEIFEIFLSDTGNNLAHFKNQGQLNKLAFTDPIIDNQYKIVPYLSFNFSCVSAPLPSDFLISITSVEISPNDGYLNVFSNDRNLNFSIQVSTFGQFPIDKLNKPMLYLHAFLNQDIIKVPFDFGDCSNVNDYLNCILNASVDVPIGFGYPDGIAYSINGIKNLKGSITGKSTFDLINTDNTIPFINTSTSIPMEAFISSTGTISTNGGNLRIEGFNLLNTKSVSIQYSDGSNQTVIPFKIFSSSILISGIKPTKNPFYIKAIDSNNQETNIYKVIPINTIDLPPAPNNEINTCKKDNNGKICNGNGSCINNKCVCFHLYTDETCSSQIIPIPQPEPSTTDPSTTFVVNNDDILKSIISVVQLRELTINNEPIKSYSFETWTRTNLSENTFQYISSINNTVNTQINVTLQWFENKTTIQFANQDLEMNPSSIKYTITLNSYEFKNQLNYLQLIMLSTVSSSNSSADCSYKNFKNQITDNDDYLRLKINGKSLMGRFIKRAIIDNVKIISISNQLLDNNMNTINNKSSTQSYIGINIPYYTKSVIVDPDFSIVYDYNNNDNTNSYCSTNQSKGGLSKLNIFGICLGGFFCLVALGIVYLKIRSDAKRKKEFKRKLKESEFAMQPTNTNINSDLENH